MASARVYRRSVVLDHRSIAVRPLRAGQHILLMVATVALSSACASLPLRGQTGSMCRPDTADYSLSQCDWVVEVVTGTDTLNARLRGAYNLQAVPASEVTIVTDAEACSRAAQVMATANGRQQYPVLLIRAGADRYVVHDGIPITPNGYLPTIVLDQNFTVLKKLAARP
jgi:hypothetical protein